MSITKLFWVISTSLTWAGGAIALRLGQAQAVLQQWRLGISLYCQGEFVLLKELWLASSALQHSTERLWRECSPESLAHFITTVKKVRPRLQRRARLLEPACYPELARALAPLEHFALCQQARSFRYRAPQNRDIAAFLHQHRHSRELIHGFNNRVLATLGKEVSGITV